MEKKGSNLRTNSTSLLNRNILKILVTAAFVFLSAFFMVFCADLTGRKKTDEVSYPELDQQRSTVSDDKRRIIIESIKLKRRNWENRGTDTVINSDGTFVVKAVFLSESKKVHEGILSRSQLEDLTILIETVNIFALENEYKGPFRTSWSWWGYILTITTKQGTKTVRFHSEDRTVPDGLNRLLKKIMEITKKIQRAWFLSQ